MVAKLNAVPASTDYILDDITGGAGGRLNVRGVPFATQGWAAQVGAGAQAVVDSLDADINVHAVLANNGAAGQYTVRNTTEGTQAVTFAADSFDFGTYFADQGGINNIDGSIWEGIGFDVGLTAQQISDIIDEIAGRITIGSS